MSLDDITASAEAARGTIDSAKSEALAAMNEASNLAQDAASRGWEGVARAVQAVRDSLEAAVANLDGAHNAVDSAREGTAAVTSTMSPKEIAKRLEGVLKQVSQADGAIGAASGSCGEAYGHAQRSEVDRLISMVNGVVGSLGTAQVSVDETKNKTETELQAAASWGN